MASQDYTEYDLAKDQRFADPYAERLARREYNMGLREAATGKYTDAQRQAQMRYAEQRYNLAGADPSVKLDSNLQDALYMSKLAGERNNLSNAARGILGAGVGGAASAAVQGAANATTPNPLIRDDGKSYNEAKGGLRGYARTIAAGTALRNIMDRKSGDLQPDPDLEPVELEEYS